jgi:class 3 adenylate cyclase/CHASE2 domain-containing sensor protein
MPVLIALGVLASVCLLRVLKIDFFEHLERMTYDMRAREALKFNPPAATNLGFVFIDDAALNYVQRTLGYGLLWPRAAYAYVIKELVAEGAKAIAFDVIFGELRLDHPKVRVGTNLVASDDFFAEQMKQAGNVFIAVQESVVPPDHFRTNALALGDIDAEKDKPEGVLRRARAFRTVRAWHDQIREAEADPSNGIDLSEAVVEKNQIVFKGKRSQDKGLGDITIALDNEGYYHPPDSAGAVTPFKPFMDILVWHMGIQLAALELKLDLNKAEIDLPHGRITLRGPGVDRIIPVDADGYFYIDWSLPPKSAKLFSQPFQKLLDDQLNGTGTNMWAGKLAVIGSTAVGNNLTDRGSTPLQEDTFLISKHWNIANSVITGRFIQRAPTGTALAIILLIGAIAAVATWELRARTLLASGLVALLLVLYAVVGTALYVQARYWIPLVLPMFGALAVHLCLVTYRVVFEQAEQRRVKSVFSKMVSPKIVHELLGKETLSLGGARREITVFFADVRGFTELTDKTQKRVDAYVKANNLTGAAAEAYIDAQARETLNTVNTYLGVIADVIKKHDGTLDKFIGDCVMAFWGAPTPNPKHALTCVRSAIEAQRAMAAMNVRRAEENKQREAENAVRVASGLEPHQPLPLLTLGTGINTGMATAGLMGSSEAESLSYTVFGREINLASRLEGASGRGRIFIGESTYAHVKRDDPELAETCVMQPPIHVKGFDNDVIVYEVPWRTADMPPAEPQPAKPVAVASVPVPS